MGRMAIVFKIWVKLGSHVLSAIRSEVLKTPAATFYVVFFEICVHHSQISMPNFYDFFCIWIFCILWCIKVEIYIIINFSVLFLFPYNPPIHRGIVQTASCRRRSSRRCMLSSSLAVIRKLSVITSSVPSIKTVADPSSSRNFC